MLENIVWDQEINLFDIYKQCSEIFMSITPSPGTNFAASFRHACSGHEAQYYGNLWSEILACDIYCSNLKPAGILEPKTGSNYRENFLEPGSIKTGDELFQNLMKRGPIIEPFLKTYGILS
ncbi:hypothetical protein MXB_1413 [Myxobolus squamalis]|nr:hypothetical protein MXB_1413 [Myxobolus squamalis]